LIIPLIRAVCVNPGYFHLCLTRVTAEPEVAPIATAPTAGADQYLLKPFTRDVVFAQLQILGMTQI